MNKIAFWEYDLFPFILSGTVTQKRSDGTVETREYGQGFFFKPVLIVPEKRGQEIRATLKALEKERDEKLNAVHVSMMRKMKRQISPVLWKSVAK